MLISHKLVKPKSVSRNVKKGRCVAFTLIFSLMFHSTQVTNPRFLCTWRDYITSGVWRYMLLKMPSPCSFWCLSAPPHQQGKTFTPRVSTLIFVIHDFCALKWQKACLSPTQIIQLSCLCGTQLSSFKHTWLLNYIINSSGGEWPRKFVFFSKCRERAHRV